MKGNAFSLPKWSDWNWLGCLIWSWNYKVKIIKSESKHFLARPMVGLRLTPLGHEWVVGQFLDRSTTNLQLMGSHLLKSTFFLLRLSYYYVIKNDTNYSRNIKKPWRPRKIVILHHWCLIEAKIQDFLRMALLSYCSHWVSNKSNTFYLKIQSSIYWL